MANIKKLHPDCTDYDKLIHIPVGFRELIPELLSESPMIGPSVLSVDLQTEYLYYLLSIIFIKQKIHHGGDDDENVFVSIYNKTANYYVRNASGFLIWLCEQHILDCNDSYEPKKYSKSYRFKTSHTFEPYILTQHNLINKVAKARKEYLEEVRNNPILSKILERLSGVELQPFAEEFVKCQRYPWGKELSILHNLELVKEKNPSKGYFLAQGGKSGRIYTPHANMPGILRRKFLIIDSEEVSEIDLKCSQLQIVFILFKDHVFPNDLNGLQRLEFQKEMKTYARCFQAGNIDLYNLLAQRMGLSRNELKKRIFPWLFSSYGQMKNATKFIEVSEIFKSLFPMLFELIMDYKKVRSNNLAVALQRIESDAIINRIAIGKVYQEGFSFITIHDAILLPLSKRDFIFNNVWMPILKELGFPEFLENVSNEFEGSSNQLLEKSETSRSLAA